MRLSLKTTLFISFSLISCTVLLFAGVDGYSLWKVRAHLAAISGTQEQQEAIAHVIFVMGVGGLINILL